MNYATVFEAYRIASHRSLRMALAQEQILGLLKLTAGGVWTDANDWASYVYAASHDYLGPRFVRATRQARTFSMWLDRRLVRVDKLRNAAREKRLREAAK